MTASQTRHLLESVKTITGWLEDYTALRTIDLLSFQDTQGIKGPLLEIGVYMGRYLAILVGASLPTNSRVVGIDTFAYTDPNAVLSGLRQLFNKQLDNLLLVKSFSSDFDSEKALDLLRDKPRFISVDGSHEVNDAFLDLCLCEEILADKGIIAVDDFLNPVAIGVNEAVNRFFHRPRRLVPFAYLPNKLLLCRPSQAQTFRDFLENITAQDKDEPKSKDFLSRMARGRQFAEQTLFGFKLLIMS